MTLRYGERINGQPFFINGSFCAIDLHRDCIDHKKNAPGAMALFLEILRFFSSDRTPDSMDHVPFSGIVIRAFQKD